MSKTNTVKLVNGTARVTFVVEQGAGQAYMINSEAEAWRAGEDPAEYEVAS